MSCKKYEKLLYLNRAGEPSGSEKKLLELHVRGCEACRDRYHSMRRSLVALKLLQEAVPKLDQPELLTKAILRQIARPNRSNQEYSLRDRIDRLSGRIATPPIRWASALVIILLLGVLVMQQFQIIYRISRLEEKVASESQLAAINQDALVNRFLDQSDLIRADDLRLRKSDSLAYFRLPEDWVIVRKQELQAWIESYETLRRTNEAALSRLVTGLSHIEGVSIKDGLNQREVRLLFKKKKEIARLIADL